VPGPRLQLLPRLVRLQRDAGAACFRVLARAQASLRVPVSQPPFPGVDASLLVERQHERASPAPSGP